MGMASSDKEKRGFKAVVFDMDGVIFDSERATMDCWIEVAEKHGIKDIESPLTACIGTNAQRTREILLEAYGCDFPYDAYHEEESRIYSERYGGGKIPVKNGASEILESLKCAGKKIALASSTRRQRVVDQLRNAGILEYFDAVIAGDMVTRSKPDPEIFLVACETIGVDPADAYAIEDSYNGIRAAHRGGLRPLMVPDMLPANEEMYELSEAVLESLVEVIEYLGLNVDA